MTTSEEWMYGSAGRAQHEYQTSSGMEEEEEDEEDAYKLSLEDAGPHPGYKLSLEDAGPHPGFDDSRKPAKVISTRFAPLSSRSSSSFSSSSSSSSRRRSSSSSRGVPPPVTDLFDLGGVVRNPTTREMNDLRGIASKIKITRKNGRVLQLLRETLHDDKEFFNALYMFARQMEGATNVAEDTFWRHDQKGFEALVHSMHDIVAERASQFRTQTPQPTLVHALNDDQKPFTQAVLSNALADIMTRFYGVGIPMPTSELAIANVLRAAAIYAVNSLMDIMNIESEHLRLILDSGKTVDTIVGDAGPGEVAKKVVSSIPPVIPPVIPLDASTASSSSKADVKPFLIFSKSSVGKVRVSMFQQMAEATAAALIPHIQIVVTDPTYIPPELLTRIIAAQSTNEDRRYDLWTLVGGGGGEGGSIEERRMAVLDKMVSSAFLNEMQSSREVLSKSYPMETLIMRFRTPFVALVAAKYTLKLLSTSRVSSGKRVVQAQTSVGVAIDMLRRKTGWRSRREGAPLIEEVTSFSIPQGPIRGSAMLSQRPLPRTAPYPPVEEFSFLV